MRRTPFEKWLILLNCVGRRHEMTEDLFLSVFAPAIMPLCVGILMNLLEGLVENFNVATAANSSWMGHCRFVGRLDSGHLFRCEGNSLL